MSSVVKYENSFPQLAPSSMKELQWFADMASKSELVPKDYQRKPSNIILAVMMGYELNIPPLQSLQGIAVINGRPCIWGDLLVAICMNSPSCAGIQDNWDEKTETWTVKAKRKGMPDVVRSFSYKDAKVAGLLGKSGPWTNYRNRMCLMRARSFALRDAFPDVLKGLSVVEESIGAGEIEILAPTEPPPINQQPVNESAIDADLVTDSDELIKEIIGKLQACKTIETLGEVWKKHWGSIRSFPSETQTDLTELKDKCKEGFKKPVKHEPKESVTIEPGPMKQSEPSENEKTRRRETESLLVAFEKSPAGAEDKGEMMELLREIAGAGDDQTFASLRAVLNYMVHRQLGEAWTLLIAKMDGMS